jgi:hypothetical protein
MIEFFSRLKPRKVVKGQGEVLLENFWGSIEEAIAGGEDI